MLIVFLACLGCMLVGAFVGCAVGVIIGTQLGFRDARRSDTHIVYGSALADEPTQRYHRRST